MTLGDISNDDPALYPLLVKAVTSLGVPWLHVPGNHDMPLRNLPLRLLAPFAAYRRAFTMHCHRATACGIQTVLVQ